MFQMENWIIIDLILRKYCPPMMFLLSKIKTTFLTVYPPSFLFLYPNFLKTLLLTLYIICSPSSCGFLPLLPSQELFSVISSLASS